MKVTVKNYLNVRVGKPSLNAPKYKLLTPGSVIEVDGQRYKGDKYEGVDTWLKDDSGNYYWSGGLLFDTSLIRNFKTEVTPSEILIDYKKLIKTAHPLPDNSGKGTNVALLDSGINTSHKDLVGAIVNSKSFITNLSPIKDNWGHGTLMAGLIAGRANGRSGIRGIASSCSIYNYRVIDDDGNTDMLALQKALIFIRDNNENLKIKIINLSLSVSDLTLVDKEINDLSKLGVKIVVAGGNENVFKYGVRLLAENENTIAVGVVDNADYPLNNEIPSRISSFFYNQFQYSCSSDNAKMYDSEKGDSIYTALTTGIICLLTTANQDVDVRSYTFKKTLFNTIELKPFY
jgi:subtilisin family serine protease